MGIADAGRLVEDSKREGQALGSVGQAKKERYRLANDSFDKGTSVWVFKNWFYRYTEGFSDEQQFQLAKERNILRNTLL